MLMKNVRAAASKVGTTVAILQDLQGPKIRVGNLKKPFPIKPGQKVTIGQDFPLDFDISSSMKKGNRILIEDGLIELKVLSVKGKKIQCEVVSGDAIRSHKGLNLPNAKIKFPILTEKDLADLKFGLKNDVDYVAMSFVRDKRDIINLKKMITKYSPKGFELPKVVAKIELAEAVKKMDEIIKEADVIMVARGDLGVEISESQVPIVQKTLIKKCLEAAKPVIVATQMLDSMIRNPRPTRAEVSDVANAVIDRADAVMLSGESAFGKFPVQTVKEMAKIIVDTENSDYEGAACIFVGDKQGSRAAAVAASACELASSTEAKLIMGATDSGFTARFLSHQRPKVPMLMLTHSPKVGRQLQLLWGVRSVVVNKYQKFGELMEGFIDIAKKTKWIKKGDKLVVSTGEPLGQKMNMVQVKTVE
jgi:pyruvate kinase